MAYKRRGYVKGESHPNAKLTEEEARLILRSADGSELLAKQFGVDPSHVRAIRRGAKWSWLVEEE